MKNRIITITLSIVLLVFLLACGAAGTTDVISERDMARICAEDPKCHAAPMWVQNQMQEEREGR